MKNLKRLLTVVFLAGAVYVGYYAAQAVATQVLGVNYTRQLAGGADVAP